MLAKYLQGVQPNNKIYVDDVFSADTYTGNDSIRSIINGIDLGGKGGLVWIKGRSGSGALLDHKLWDTARGQNRLRTSSTAVQETFSGTQGVYAFNNNGFSMGIGSASYVNDAGADYVAWTFRKAPKFFDVVTWTGNAIAGRQISHGLGAVPGMMLVKSTSNSAMNWCVWHNSMGGVPAGNGWLYLNTTAAPSTNNGEERWGTGPGGSYIAPTSTNFTVASDTQVNGNGDTYVAYIFAHDPSVDGMIQCGSFTDSSGGVNVNLGWEAQYVMMKRSDGTSNWVIYDTARNWSMTDGGELKANTSAAEAALGGPYFSPSATGFQTTTALFANGATVIYMAIRRPMKIPTLGSQVYNAISRTGTGAAVTVTGAGFVPDLILSKSRNYNNYPLTWFSRLRGSYAMLQSSNTDIEYSGGTNSLTSFGMDGYSAGADNAGTKTANINWTTDPYINYLFKRAPGFMDEVCYTGTGVAGNVSHNLGVVPELCIVKSRSGTEDWYVTHGPFATGHFLMNSTNAKSAFDIWTTDPTSTTFPRYTSDADTNLSGRTYVAYLFASCPGVSKVGSYVGDGASVKNIDCGFSAGARFVLIKSATSSSTQWYVFDTARGIVSGNDPYFYLNTTSSEVTGNDVIDPYSAGFTVGGAAPIAINTNGETFIYLAIA